MPMEGTQGGVRWHLWKRHKEVGRGWASCGLLPIPAPDLAGAREMTWEILSPSRVACRGKSWHLEAVMWGGGAEVVPKPCSQAKGWREGSCKVHHGALLFISATRTHLPIVPPSTLKSLLVWKIHSILTFTLKKINESGE